MQAKTYENFLKEKIVLDNGICGSFLEEDGNVYIISGNHKILFKMKFKEEYYDVLLKASKELLFAYLIMYKEIN